MKNLPLVSVIIPCFNAQNYIKNCVNSLKNQTYGNAQFIFVDDFSTDNTFNILTEFTSSDDRIKVYKTNKKGVFSARNLGIDNACGDFITFMDCDDVVSPFHLELLIKKALENNADVVVSNYKRVYNKKNYEDYKFKKIKKYKVKTFDKISAIKEFLAQRLEFCVWNKLYRKDIIDKNNIRFDEKCTYNEDSLFNYKVLKFASKTLMFSAVTYYYVQRKGSLVNRPFSEAKLTCFLSLNNIVNDAYKSLPNVIHYAHLMRLTLCCEMLFYIKFCKYSNGKVIKKIIDYTKTDAEHVKFCKRSKLYRRLLMPLVPAVAKLLLYKRKSFDGIMLEQFEITDK